jgi:FSR family fosmidomycin resistance protein-like MFS transporter
VRAELDRRGIAALSGGHGAVDFASGAVPALLPFLAERFALSYTLTAVLMLCATVSSSIVQPLFGLLSDRRGAMWLLPGGVLVAGVGIALTGVAPSYGLALVTVFLAGIGIAAYHPEGAKFASYASGRRRASGMSLFNVGGNTGYALGPIVITPVVVWLGMSGTLLAALPVLLVGVGIMLVLPYLRNLRPVPGPRSVAGEDRPRAMAILVGVILLRSTTWFGLITFVPLWVVSLGHSKAEGNRLLSLMLVAGVVGALVLGPVADRVGLRRTLLGSTMALPPLVLTFVYVGGPAGAVALMLVGGCVVGTFGIVMVLSQLYLPRHVAMASGLNVGLAVGLGGLAAVALGAVADAVDLEAALTVCAIAPVGAALLCLRLPSPHARLAAAPAGA